MNLLNKTGLTYFWGKLKAFFVKGNARVFYGTCDTAAATAAKVVVCPDFTSADIENGTAILVKFSAANSTNQAITLNVNDTGAFPVKIIHDGTTADIPSAAAIRGATHLFHISKTASNTYWVLDGIYWNTTYSAMTQAEIDAGTGTIGRRITPALLRDNFYTEDEVDNLISGLGGGTPVETTQPAGGMLPNVVYDLGSLTGSVTFSLAAATDQTIANPYHWTFETGSTAPTVTWPTGLTWTGGSAPTINTSKHYEIMVRNNYATSLEF